MTAAVELRLDRLRSIFVTPSSTVNGSSRIASSGGPSAGSPPDPRKLELIDRAFGELGSPPEICADLGGVWGVEGAYTFHILANYSPRRVHLVDDVVTPTVEAWARRFPQLRLHQGLFGNPEIVSRLGRLDTVLLFDVLLHQAAPDWREILELYAARTSRMLIFNPQYVAAERSVRLPDLGLESYFEIIPHQAHEPTYCRWVQRMEETDPVRGLKWRDVHDVWQWGITDRDLRLKMRDLGFRLRWRVDHGAFGELAHFHSMAYVFEQSA